MKTWRIIFLLVIAVFLFSCSGKKTVKNVTIHANAKIFCLVDRDAGKVGSYNIRLLVPADTNYDGFNDIRIRITADGYISGSLFLYFRQALPDKDILVKEVTYVPKKGSWRISGDFTIKE
jgi:hypothetical protein